MATKTFNRFEIKFLINKEQMSALLPELNQYFNPDNYNNSNQYSINNIYFDTENDDIIRKSIAKPYYKEKLRLRSYYIPQSYDDKVFLEIKKKIGKNVNKRRASMTLGQAYDFVSNCEKPQNLAYLDDQVCDEIKLFLDNYKVYPKVYIGYNRLAFVSKDDKNLRLTFDYNIRTRRNNVGLENGDYGFQLINEDMILMEIKYNIAIPFYLSKILSGLSIYEQSFSKYGTEYKNYCLGIKDINLPIKNLKESIINR